MKVAVPVVQGQLSLHFGHCETFALFDVNREEKKVLGSETLPAPPHQPGLLPRWLHEKGANVIIAGGMGMRAQDLFRQNNVEVIVGAPSAPPEEVVQSWLDGTLVSGENLCDH
jgi:predicted Fe-Mo cluster-binding NifX family protein